MIRVAILGAGIGQEHLAGYRALPEHFEVAMIVDRDAARLAQITGAHRACETLEAALDDPLIDLIDICLPPDLHAQIAIAALQAGKHVICEKPLATSLADVDRVAQAAQRSGCAVFPVFQYRFGPAFRALRALDAAGLLGPAHVASVETHWSRDAGYYAVPWRGTWAGERGGALLGHAIHAHDLLHWLFGPVDRITARTATRINPIETEDCAALLVEFENGALATSSVTLGAAQGETRLRLVYGNLTATSDRVAYAPGTGTWRFEARDPARQAAVDRTVADAEAGHNGFAGFLHSVALGLQGQPSAVTLAEARASIEGVTAAYLSARTGQTVALPLDRTCAYYEGWQP
ncbi:MAG: Gfo/Idh/MocA family oxidoreductase [Pseudomonadota bacterium]